MKVECKYTDGQSAAIQKVDVLFSKKYLSFNDKTWFYSEIKTSTLGTNEWLVQLGDEEVFIDKDSFEKTHLFELSRPSLINRLHWSQYLVSTLVIVFFFIYFTPQISKFISNFIPTSLEENLGDQIVKSLPRPQGCKLENQRKVIQKISDNLSREGKYKIGIIKNNDVNAFAIPGGHILFTTGALEVIKDQSELVGVLAHEIQHHIQKHHIQKVIEHFLTSLVWMTAFSNLGDVAIIDPEILRTLFLNSYSVETEKSADLNAIKFLKNKGHSPIGLSVFLGKIKEEEEKRVKETQNSISLSLFNKVKDFFSTHPETSERINYIQESTKSENLSANILSKEEWSLYEKDCINKF